jgi:hypothetical protein
MRHLIMNKHFCDECGKELTDAELQFSLEMTGKELCSKHIDEMYGNKKELTLEANGRTYKKDSGGFIYPEN